MAETTGSMCALESLPHRCERQRVDVAIDVDSIGNAVGVYVAAVDVGAGTASGCRQRQRGEAAVDVDSVAAIVEVAVIGIAALYVGS